MYLFIILRVVKRRVRIEPELRINESAIEHIFKNSKPNYRYCVKLNALNKQMFIKFENLFTNLILKIF